MLRKNHSYIKLDLTQGTPDDYRLQTKITPEEHSNGYKPIVYMQNV